MARGDTKCNKSLSVMVYGRLKFSPVLLYSTDNLYVNLITELEQKSAEQIQKRAMRFHMKHYFSLQIKAKLSPLLS